MDTCTSEFLTLGSLIRSALGIEQKNSIGKCSKQEEELEITEEVLYLSGTIKKKTDEKKVKPSKHPEQTATIAAKLTPFSLLELCAQQIMNCNVSVYATRLELAEAIIEMVKSAKGKEDILQMHLVDLLGFEALDFISELLASHQIVASFNKRQMKQADEVLDAQERLSSLPQQKVAGGSVSIQSETERIANKRIQKQARREGRRVGNNEATATPSWLEEAGYDMNIVRETRERQLERNFATHTPSLLQEAFGNIEGGFQINDPKSSTLLPKNTERIQTKEYEKVHIPASIPSPSELDSKILVPVTEMTHFAQSAFYGISHLNRLQSKLFHAAYQSGDNLLVCAPTGAGKTNVAMMTILHEVEMHLKRSPGSFSKFKIIYVAPMKALAQEVVEKFSKRLSKVNLRVAELTGDMQMTKKEIEVTQLIVTTPEKWDVITRKSHDESLVAQVRLLIIDEVHLLADGRGSVIETIVARTLRLVETSQSLIRIVGLSATLPNYQDVAQFLRVHPSRGLFHFDGSFRPVPLTQNFVGVNSKLSRQKSQQVMNRYVYEEALTQIRNQEQVMIFVHSRKETANTIRSIIELAIQEGTIDEFDPLHSIGDIDEDEDEEEKEENEELVTNKKQRLLRKKKKQLERKKKKHQHNTTNVKSKFVDQVGRSRNKDLREFFDYGFGIHHAGMLRSDRNISEKAFESGAMKVLCSTATLAWGVNLPAHAVYIKGTEVYNAEKGGMTQLGMLDIMQIFGRAGRPQYDSTGEATLITQQTELPHYLRLLTHQMPIESSLIKALPDHLNAEIVSGTVTTLSEAITWLSYTYLHVRMRRNPMVYGLSYDEVALDPTLAQKRKQLIEKAAQTLDNARMIRYDQQKGHFAVVNVGRVASHYYISHASIETFNELLQDNMQIHDVLKLICSSSEFEQIKVRDEELGELEKLQRKFCKLEVAEGVSSPAGKTNILLQSCFSQAPLTSFTLISDTNYIAQNAGRVTRALFEIVLKKNWSNLAAQLLTVAKSIDLRLWWTVCPLRQIPSHGIPYECLSRLEYHKADQIDHLLQMSPQEIGDMVNHPPKMGSKILKKAKQIPFLKVEAFLQPLTSSILRMTMDLIPCFQWDEKVHGSCESYWLWVEDVETRQIYHSEYYILSKKHYLAYHEQNVVQRLSFSLPLFNFAKQTGYTIRVLSDRWIGVETISSTDLTDIKLIPKSSSVFTKPLTHLHALCPADVLENQYGSSTSFQRMNFIQTQVFHRFYHQDGDGLLCAPSGTGKTFLAEVAMFRFWNDKRKGKKQTVLCLIPIDMVVKDRVRQWQSKFSRQRKVLEVTKEMRHQSFHTADVLVSTPEVWCFVMRQQKEVLIGNIGLVLLDNLELIGDGITPALEVVISRMRLQYHSKKKREDNRVRFLGFANTLANGNDMAHWLGITNTSSKTSDFYYNFSTSTRMTPLEILTQGFPGRNYMARMAMMNKPIYAAIQAHTKEDQSALVFVSSRSQTRLTALDLISSCAAETIPKPFLRMDEAILDNLVARIQDPTLRHSIAFGIGLYHTGLSKKDRHFVVDLFRQQHIRVLICTSEFAWHETILNSKIHLVIVKGTESYDVLSGRYADYSLSHVVQMISRAGLNSNCEDSGGIACVLVDEQKKNYYKKFLYEPLPLESCLHEHVTSILHAEISSGRITTAECGLNFLSWTFLFQRLVANPSYYGLLDNSSENVKRFLLSLIQQSLLQLTEASCIEVKGNSNISPTFFGSLSNKHAVEFQNCGIFYDELTKVPTELCPTRNATRIEMLPYYLAILCEASEYRILPTRFHEEKWLMEFIAYLPHNPYEYCCKEDKPRVFTSSIKVFVLFQLYLSRGACSISTNEWRSKTKLLTDHFHEMRIIVQTGLRLLRTMIEIAAEFFSKRSFLLMDLIQLHQCLTQGHWPGDSDIWQLSSVSTSEHRQLVEILKQCDIETLQSLVQCTNTEDGITKLRAAVEGKNLFLPQLNNFINEVQSLPCLKVSCSLRKNKDSIEVKFRTTSHFKHHVNASEEQSGFHGYWIILLKVQEQKLSSEGQNVDAQEEVVAFRKTCLSSKSAVLQIPDLVGKELKERQIANDDTLFLELLVTCDSISGLSKRLRVEF